MKSSKLMAKRVILPKEERIKVNINGVRDVLYDQ